MCLWSVAKISKNEGGTDGGLEERENKGVFSVDGQKT